MRLEKCYYCSSTVYPGHGMIYFDSVARNATSCSRRRRNPRKAGWTKASRRLRGKELTDDSVLELEQRRNVPTKYERALWKDAIETMKESHEIKHKRYAQLITNTLKPGKKLHKASRIVSAKKKVHMLRAPVAEKEEEGELLEITVDEIKTEDEADMEQEV